jgi:hypothetical protein
MVTKIETKHKPKSKKLLIVLLAVLGVLAILLIGAVIIEESNTPKGGLKVINNTIQNGENPKEISCIPDWQCGEWGTCSASRSQKRVCIDSNNCSLSNGTELRACEVKLVSVEIIDEINEVTDLLFIKVKVVNYKETKFYPEFIIGVYDDNNEIICSRKFSPPSDGGIFSTLFSIYPNFATTGLISIMGLCPIYEKGNYKLTVDLYDSQDTYAKKLDSDSKNFVVETPATKLNFSI